MNIEQVSLMKNNHFYTGFPLVVVPSSLTPENYAGTLKFGMPPWRPLYAGKWIAPAWRRWTPKNCYLGARRTEAWLLNSFMSYSS